MVTNGSDGDGGDIGGSGGGVVVPRGRGGVGLGLPETTDPISLVMKKISDVERKSEHKNKGEKALLLLPVGVELADGDWLLLLHIALAMVRKNEEDEVVSVMGWWRRWLARE
ncbi:hypothetical protein RND71_017713 [Anisodus tanguticus]|uniref:Uncharacterized protein n=1 Tax=Anisodus tanguticus TaxID=243964 RepID=A0AAE1S3C9_9SOLA|nr:hypothetical protein RND71_017713 [Anisodus tanguticus]